MSAVVLFGVADAGAKPFDNDKPDQSMAYKIITTVMVAIIFVIVVAFFSIVREFYACYFTEKYGKSSKAELMTNVFFAATAAVVGLALIPIFICLAKMYK